MFAAVLVYTCLNLCSESMEEKKVTPKAFCCRLYYARVYLFTSYSDFKYMCSDLRNFSKKCFINPESIKEGELKGIESFRIQFYFFSKTKPLEYIFTAYFLKENTATALSEVCSFCKKITVVELYKCALRNVKVLSKEKKSLLLNFHKIKNVKGLFFLVDSDLVFANEAIKYLGVENRVAIEPTTSKKNFEFIESGSGSYELKITSDFAVFISNSYDFTNFSVLAYDDNYFFYHVYFLVNRKINFFHFLTTFTQDA